MKRNATICADVNGSLYKNTPRISMIVGAMYCRKPSIANGILLAPLANNCNGTAVATPASINNKFSGELKELDVTECSGIENK